jgi:probable F420-dependent oxidoreductase
MTHPFRFGVLSMQRLMSPTDLVERARLAEATGYSTFQVSDHFARSPFSPLLALAVVATATSTLRLGTLVLDNDFRHPAVLAKEAATLDVLSCGRLELGLGAGWMTDDYATSGIPFDTAGTRISRLGETLSVLRAVLGPVQPASFAGQHFSVTEMTSVPCPVQPGGPVILVGGGRPKILALAAGNADVVSVNMDVSEGRVGVRAAQSAYAQATDEKLGWVRAAAGDRFDGLELHLMAYWSQITDDPLAVAAERIERAGLEITPEDLLASPHCLIGPLEALVERLLERRERWGFSYISFYDSDAKGCAPLVDALAGR